MHYNINNTRLSKSPMAFFITAILFSIFINTSFAHKCEALSVTQGALRYKLDNGLNLILKEDHSSPVVAIQVWVKTGSANETEKEAGITHLIEHMIFKGTPTRKTGEIARTIEASGGQINAYTSYDRTVYYVEIPSRHFETGLDVLLDAIQYSVFDPVELKREKEVVLEEYRRGLDSPWRRLSKVIMRLCFQTHPYGRPIIGYESTIKSFERRDIINYIEKWYSPQNMVLVVTGDFKTEQALKLIKKYTENFPPRSHQIPERPKEPEQKELREKIIKDNVQQIYMDLAWHIPPLNHPDTPAIDVLELLLGGGKSSRLYDRLKMKSNLVHTVGAGAYELQDYGLFFIDATLGPENLNKALKAISEEIAQLATGLISHAELEKAKAIVEADFLYDMETMSGQARTLGFFEAMEGNISRCDQYLKQLQAVTSADIKRVVRSYFSPHRLSVAMLVPMDKSVDLSRDELVKIFSFPSTKTVEHSKSHSNTTQIGAKKFVLNNGIRVIIKENHRLPTVSMVTAFLGGSRLEKKDVWGISAFGSSLLTRGTKSMTAPDIAQKVDSLGGQLESFSGRNSFGITAKFLSRDIDKFLGLVSDLILHPAFPLSEIEKVREDMLSQIRAKKDRPMSQLFDLFYATLYKHHPYGHPRTGTEQTIEAIQRSDILQWYKSLVTGSNCVISIVGDVDPEMILKKLSLLYGPMPQTSSPLPTIAPEPSLKGPRTKHVKRDGAQTNLVIGFLGASLGSKYDPPMALVDAALSGQGGRLFYRLRDQQSLAYSVTSFRRPGLETGAFAVYLGCAPGKVETARKAILKELMELREKGLTKEELASAKKYLLGNIAIESQTNMSQAMEMALNELYGLGFEYQDRYLKKIEAVTLDQVQEAVSKIIFPDRYVYISLGP